MPQKVEMVIPTNKGERIMSDDSKAEFVREKRYIITKIGKPGWNKACVIVEEDWPEYEPVWKMIQDRMEGKPNELTALQASCASSEAEIALSHEAFETVKTQLNLMAGKYVEANAKNTELLEQMGMMRKALETRKSADR
jgi:hypothetical protein